MSSLYQPPAIPGTSGGLSGNHAPTANPYFTVANQFLPRNLHDVIRWAKYITTQSPVTTEVLRKFSTYPITDFTIDTKSPAIREKYEEIFKKFRLKAALHDIGFEYHSVGNVFISIYFPIHRNLVCPHCRATFAAKAAKFTTFKKFGFYGTCPKCHVQHTKFEVHDTKSMSVNDMNLVKWDPLNINVNHNPITNEYQYYYAIPNEIKRKITQGDKLFVNTVPWGFIEAVEKNEDFMFDPGNLFHMKNMSAGQQINGVSVPPLISLFGLVFYQATLRKANESISTDFMNPLRVIYPAAQTGNSDPVVTMSLHNFANRMEEAMVRHKRDKNHVLIAPMPIGYQAVSGEGKNLLVSQEIQQAEESILLALGVSRELLSGVTNWTSSTVGLRLLENTLMCYTGQVVELLEWVMTKVSTYLSIETSKVGLVPFKLTDDDALRNLLTQLYMNGATVSKSTLFESLGIDGKTENKRAIQDAVEAAITKIKADLETNKASFIASREAGDQLDTSGDYKVALQKAQAFTMQLATLDENQAREILYALEVEDYAMFIMVTRLMERQREESVVQAQAQTEMNAAIPPEEGGEGGGGKPPAKKTEGKEPKAEGPSGPPGV